MSKPIYLSGTEAVSAGYTHWESMPEVLTFEYWREYLDEHDPDGSRNLWGFALPMMAKAFEIGKEIACAMVNDKGLESS